MALIDVWTWTKLQLQSGGLGFFYLFIVWLVGFHFVKGKGLLHLFVLHRSQQKVSFLNFTAAEFWGFCQRRCKNKHYSIDLILPLAKFTVRASDLFIYEA